MGEFRNQLFALTNALIPRADSDHGGVISGDNPTHYNPANPIRLWVIQAVIIITLTQTLSLGLARLRQPRVIAEVIGGVILGPTIMGRIPGFTEAIFPDASIPLLNLTSTIGLLLFLFLVGLEIDTRLLRRNMRASAAVSVAGLVVPLGLGAALAVGVYNQFIDPSVNFGHFTLFTAVAVGITAFPVLCRILTELKLLDTAVGAVVLSAGIGNDVIGWILLALTVALVNASSGLTALYVLLICAGYVAFVLYPGRWAFVWLAKRTGSLEQGTPTPFMMTVTLIFVFVSAFFTDAIGVHAIFGGFVAGLIIPHENGFAISLVEKLEDLVSIIFLPIYFALSGLKTNLGLLDNGITWGFTILICAVAFFSKFIACAGVALCAGFSWRESGAIGALMSCKGLVELIVLNIGLQAGILDDRTFSMFVVHALVLTILTTPLTLAFYPAKCRIPLQGRPELSEKEPETASIDLENRVLPPPGLSAPGLSGADCNEHGYTFSLILDKIEQLPAAMTLSKLIHSTTNPISPIPRSTLTHHPSDVKAELDSVMSSPGMKPSAITSNKRTISISGSSLSSPTTTINALRLIELTTRTSAVLRSQEAEAIHDPMMAILRTFGDLNGLKMSSSIDITNFDDFPGTISRHAANTNSHMILLPWSRGPFINGGPLAVRSASPHPFQSHHSQQQHGQSNLGQNQYTQERGSTLSPGPIQTTASFASVARNPFDGIFIRGTPERKLGQNHNQTNSVVYSEFIRKVFSSAGPSHLDVALFVDRGFGVSHPAYHLYLPFLGGPDDRLALRFLIELCGGNENVVATVIRVTKTEGPEAEAVGQDGSTPASSLGDQIKVPHAALAPPMAFTASAVTDTAYSNVNTQVELASETADNLLWMRYAQPTQAERDGSNKLAAALSRTTFVTKATSKPLHTIADWVHAGLREYPKPADPPYHRQSRTPIIFIGRSRRLSPESHKAELNELIHERGGGTVLISSSLPRTLGDVGAALVATNVDASLMVVQAGTAKDEREGGLED